MSETRQWNVPCRQGWLIVTRGKVRLLRRGRIRATWEVDRSSLRGASLGRTTTGYALTLHAGDGRSWRVQPTDLRDSCRLIAALGLVLLSPANRYAPLPALTAPVVRFAHGRIQLSGEGLTIERRRMFQPRQSLSLRRTDIVGASATRRSGWDMPHDLTLYTRRGDQITLVGLRPGDAFGLLRTLGPAAGTLPAEPVPQRRSRKLHLRVPPLAVNVPAPAWSGRPAHALAFRGPRPAASRGAGIFTGRTAGMAAR